MQLTINALVWCFVSAHYVLAQGNSISSSGRGVGAYILQGLGSSTSNSSSSSSFAPTIRPSTTWDNTTVHSTSPLSTAPLTSNDSGQKLPNYNNASTTISGTSYVTVGNATIPTFCPYNANADACFSTCSSYAEHCYSSWVDWIYAASALYNASYSTYPTSTETDLSTFTSVRITKGAEYMGYRLTLTFCNSTWSAQAWSRRREHTAMTLQSASMRLIAGRSVRLGPIRRPRTSIHSTRSANSRPLPLLACHQHLPVHHNCLTDGRRALLGQIAIAAPSRAERCSCYTFLRPLQPQTWLTTALCLSQTQRYWNPQTAPLS